MLPARGAAARDEQPGRRLVLGNHLGDPLTNCTVQFAGAVHIEIKERLLERFEPPTGALPGAPRACRRFPLFWVP